MRVQSKQRGSSLNLRRARGCFTAPALALCAPGRATIRPNPYTRFRTFPRRSDGEEVEEYKSTKKAKATKKTAKKKSARKPSAAFMRPVSPSPALAEIIGSKAVPRTEVTKRLWAYIKKNKLQDAKNKRMINADAPLKVVFGGKSSVNMFEMTKLVGKHLK